MKTLVTFTLCLLAISWAKGGTPAENFSAALSTWKSASSSLRLTEFAAVEAAWTALPEADKEVLWQQMVLADFKESEKCLEAQNPIAAAHYLSQAGTLYQSRGGHLG